MATTPRRMREPNANPRRPLTVEVNHSFGSHESSGPTPEPSPEGPPKATEYHQQFVDQFDTEEEDEVDNGGDNDRQRNHEVLLGGDTMMLRSVQEMNRSNQQQDVRNLNHLLVHRRIPSPYSPPPDSLLVMDDDHDDDNDDEEKVGPLPTERSTLDQQQQHVPPLSNRNRGHSHRSRQPLLEVVGGSVEGSHHRSVRSATSTRNNRTPGDDVVNGRGGGSTRAHPPPPINNSFSFEADLQQQLRHLAVLNQQYQQQHQHRSASSPASASMHTAAQQLSSPASQPLNHSQPHIHRSQLVPAVLQLKRELIDAHQATFLLKREHEAAEAKHLEAQTQLQSKVDQLQEELGALRQSNSDLVKQLEEAADETKSADSHVRALTTEKAEVEAQLQAVSTEKSELQVALRDRTLEVESATAAYRDLSESVASLERQLQRLADEKVGLVEEVQHLRGTLERDQAADASMIQALQKDKDALQNEVAVAKGILDRTDSELKESRDQVQLLQDELREARAKIKQVTLESTQRANELQERVDSIQVAERQGRESSQSEIERLKARLKEAELKFARQEKETSAAKDELKAEIVALEKKHKTSASECAALRGEKLALRKELSSKTQQLQRLEAITTNDAACQTDARPAAHDFGTQTEDEEQLSDLSLLAGAGRLAGDVATTSLAERIGRVRDASDRATLTQAYRREVNRMQAEHAAELRKAEESYNASLSGVIHDAKTEVQRQTKDHKVKLKAEWESKLSSLEARHRIELDQARNDFEARMAAADVAVEAAAAELVLTQQALERETSRRLQLEQETSSLKAQVDVHKQRERDVVLQKDQETKSLLSSIRDECNMAFDKRGVRVASSTFQHLSAIGSTATLTTTSSDSKSPSPRSVAFSEASSSSPDQHHHQHPSTPANGRTVTATPRPRLHVLTSTPRGAGAPTSPPVEWSQTEPGVKNIDHALDETEILVRSLLG